MIRNWIRLLRRGLAKPPRVVFARALRELRAESDRLLLHPRLCVRAEPAITAGGDIGRLWRELGSRSYVARAARGIGEAEPASIDRLRVVTRAEAALARRVDLLGSGPIELGETIDWQRDYKTGYTWPLEYAQRMAYGAAPGGPDIKFPWELSRLHWLLPAGQAYLLTGDQRFAAGS